MSSRVVYIYFTKSTCKRTEVYQETTWDGLANRYRTALAVRKRMAIGIFSTVIHAANLFIESWKL
jgi:hypothetical protein